MLLASLVQVWELCAAASAASRGTKKRKTLKNTVKNSKQTAKQNAKKTAKKRNSKNNGKSECVKNSKKMRNNSTGADPVCGQKHLIRLHSWQPFSSWPGHEASPLPLMEVRAGDSHRKEPQSPGKKAPPQKSDKLTDYADPTKITNPQSFPDPPTILNWASG